VSGIPRKHALFVPATTFTRVRLRIFCLRKRPSFLASRRFAQENPTHALMANSGSSFEVTVFAQLLSFSASKLLIFLPSPVSTFFKRALVIPAESSGLEVLNDDVLREEAFTGNGVGFSLSRH